MGDQPFVAEIQIGDARVTALNEGTALWAPELTAAEAEWRPEIPEADDQGRIPINFFTVYVRVGDRSVIVDPGFDDPANAEISAADIPPWPRSTRTPGLLVGLTRAGVDAEGVTDVLISHTHVDHFRGVTLMTGREPVPRFGGARVHLSRLDWEGDPERADSRSDISVRLGRIKQLGLLELIDGDVAVAPGVEMIHAPGESPGHSVIRVTSRGKPCTSLETCSTTGARSRTSTGRLRGPTDMP